MLESLQSYCQNFYYKEDARHWVGFISKNYHPELEIYIAGDPNGPNQILEQAAIQVIKNIRAVESRVRAYLAQIESTTFRPTGTILRVDQDLNTENAWDLMWLNFCDLNHLDQYEAVCRLHEDPDDVYAYMLWVVTLHNDIPIAHHGQFW
jgi:hypothetical protein